MKVNNIIALAGVSFFVFCQATWKFFESEKLYYLGAAVFYVTILYAFSRNLKAHSFHWFLAFDYFFDLSVWNLLDELFFKPTKLEVSEYLYIILAMYITAFRWLLYKTKLNPLTLLKRLFYGKSKTKDDP